MTGPEHSADTVAMTEYERECIETALEIAYDLLSDAENYDVDSRIVPTDAILRIVQELNAALRGQGQSVEVSSEEKRVLAENATWAEAKLDAERALSEQLAEVLEREGHVAGDPTPAGAALAAYYAGGESGS